MDEKRFRLDFVIAFCALLISTVAAVATVYQTRVIASQFSATVWPYVSFDATYTPWSAEVDLRNDGLGPAIVRSVAITLDGKRQDSIEVLLSTLRKQETRAIATALRAGEKLRITTSTPTSGLVLPANTQHIVVRVEGARLVQYVRPNLKRVGISLCYCSLTGTCWTQTYQLNETEPKPVSSCSRS